MNARSHLAALLLLSSLAGPAAAANDSLLTLGVGAQYGFVSSSVSEESPDAPDHQYGLVTRLKLLRFIGLEAATQLDHDPGSQTSRLLSPRYQLGLMANLPIRYVSIFAIGGIAAHNGGDLVSPSGATTSFHLGAGVEFFVGEHLALGGDLRYRVPGVRNVQERIERIQTGVDAPEAPEGGLFDVWQINFTISYYL